MLFFDPMYLLFALPGLAASLWASARVSSAFNKWKQVGTYNGMTGAQAAWEVLRRAGIHDVQIVRTPGSLTDHYDPVGKRLALSEEVHDNTSVAAIGVATHEAGHALQHATGYAPLWIRSLMVQPANFGAMLSPYIIIAGALFHAPVLVNVGLILFGALVAFQLVTLPVEFDASNRAKRLVLESGIVYPQEREGIDKVLNAAALTYVAAALTGFLTLLYYLLRFGGMGSNQSSESA
jgi:Zn-dependent membrane protease YugP